MDIKRKQTLQERYDNLPQTIRNKNVIKTTIGSHPFGDSAQDSLYVVEKAIKEIADNLNYITLRLYGENLIDASSIDPKYRGIESSAHKIAKFSVELAEEVWKLEKLI